MDVEDCCRLVIPASNNALTFYSLAVCAVSGGTHMKRRGLLDRLVPPPPPMSSQRKVCQLAGGAPLRR